MAKYDIRLCFEIDDAAFNEDTGEKCPAGGSILFKNIESGEKTYEEVYGNLSSKESVDEFAARFLPTIEREKVRVVSEEYYREEYGIDDE